MDSKNTLIYNRVKNVISKFNTNDPFEIARGSNIKIKYFNDATKLLGMYTVIERNRFIFLNSRMQEYMIRMVLAHELGHDALHRHLTKNSPFKEYQIFDITSEPEYEANIFAAHLLLDENKIVELINEEYTDVEIASILNVNLNLLIFKMNEMNRYGANYNLRHAPKGNFFNKVKI
ncbi:ImmA/IrrE family metallo-endopeptidase [Senegalia sp. (in: firmicutes)]|uniref:ImmA/IrrE family metallo-endopeptidase n=1 Tax=Senegalia sp. (in: firmicutes) TaxID=1924098 RepID=UPI003F95730B